MVDIALEDGSAFTGDGWKYISSSFQNNTVHFVGLLSDGGVHSRYDQLAAFVKGAQKHGAKRIRVHFLTVSLPDDIAILPELTLPKSASYADTCHLYQIRMRRCMWVSCDFVVL